MEIPFARNFLEADSYFSVPIIPDFSRHKRSESTLIFEFLKKLNTFPLEIAKTAQEFDELYFTAIPHFTHGDVKMLLSGEEKLKGLLHFCGDEKNYIASRSCIQLFSKLISYEHNSLDADKFASILGSFVPEIIKSMNLEYAIKGIKTPNAPGQNILYQYLLKNTHGVTHSNEILNEKTAIDEYEKWAKKKYPSTVTVKQDPSSKLEDKLYLNSIMQKNMGDMKITRLLVESSNLSSLNDMESLMNQLDSYTGWKMIDSTGEVDAYTKGPKHFRLTLRLKTKNVKLATKYFYELEKREQWDPLHHITIQKDSCYQDIVQIVYEYNVKKWQYVEYVMFRNIGKSEDGKSVIIILRSILLPISPSPQIKRTHVNACVYKITLREEVVECQILWKVDEGIETLAEYAIMVIKKKIEGCIETLNELIEENNKKV